MAKTIVVKFELSHYGRVFSANVSMAMQRTERKSKTGTLKLQRARRSEPG